MVEGESARPVPSVASLIKRPSRMNSTRWQN
jgi:hypothetical protein